MDINNIKKRSKHGAIISLIGLLIIIIAFGIAAISLRRLQQTIESKKHEIIILDSTKIAQEKEIDGNNKVISELVDEINRLKDPTICPHARAIAIPGLLDSQKRQVYDFTVWITSSQFTLNRIRKVSYQFGHETFIIKNRESEDSSNGFLVSYRGWGCMALVKISVEYVNQNSEIIYFDMCNKIEVN